MGSRAAINSFVVSTTREYAPIRRRITSVQRSSQLPGVVTSIWDAGGRNLLVIEDTTGGEQLVPAVEPLLREVDLEARRIVVDPPPGLLDLYASEED